jgi:peptidoglycan/LPS O-acetylase OafA/YrhL
MVHAVAKLNFHELLHKLGVDTFFFIGGFLLSFVGKSRPVPVLLGTGLRYLRLLPLLGFVQMVYILIAPYLVFGPFAPRFQNGVLRSKSRRLFLVLTLFQIVPQC